MSLLALFSVVRLPGREMGRRFLSMSLVRRHNPGEGEEKSCSKAESQAEKLR